MSRKVNFIRIHGDFNIKTSALNVCVPCVIDELWPQPIGVTTFQMATQASIVLVSSFFIYLVFSFFTKTFWFLKIKWNLKIIIQGQLFISVVGVSLCFQCMSGVRESSSLRCLCLLKINKAIKLPHVPFQQARAIKPGSRLVWTISYKSRHFVDPSLELMPLFTGERQRSMHGKPMIC